MNAIMNYFNPNHPSRQAWEKVRKNYRIYRAMPSNALDEGRDNRHFVDPRTNEMLHSGYWKADSNYRKILAKLAAYQEGYLNSWYPKSPDLDDPTNTPVTNKSP